MAYVKHVLRGKPGVYQISNGTQVHVPPSGDIIVWHGKEARSLIRLGCVLVEDVADAASRAAALATPVIADTTEEEEDEDDDGDDELALVALPPVDPDAPVTALHDQEGVPPSVVLTTDTVNGVAKSGGRKTR